MGRDAGSGFADAEDGDAAVGKNLEPERLGEAIAGPAGHVVEPEFAVVDVGLCVRFAEEPDEVVRRLRPFAPAGFLDSANAPHVRVDGDGAENEERDAERENRGGRGEEPFGLAPVAAAADEMDGLDGQEDRAPENGRAREAEAGEHAERREPPCDGFREAKAKSRKRRFGPRRDEHGHVCGENGERCGAEQEEVADGSSHGVLFRLCALRGLRVRIRLCALCGLCVSFPLRALCGLRVRFIRGKALRGGVSR